MNEQQELALSSEINPDLKPNFTVTPNVILDRWQPILSAPGFCCLMVAVRKTYGWHKEDDEISQSQFEAGTGKSRTFVRSGVRELLAVELLVLVAAATATTGARYKINLMAGLPPRPEGLENTGGGDGKTPLNGNSEGLEQPPQNKASLKKSKKEKIAAEAASLYTRVVALIVKAHHKLTGEALTFHSFGKAYGQAVKDIIAMAGAGTDDELFAIIRRKVGAYYNLCLSEATQLRKFYTQQGITPLSIRSSWNKLVEVGATRSAFQPAEEKKFPDVMQMTDEQIASEFSDWQKKFTMTQVREGLPAAIWEKWQTEKRGFAAALGETIMAYKKSQATGGQNVTG